MAAALLFAAAGGQRRRGLLVQRGWDLVPEVDLGVMRHGRDALQLQVLTRQQYFIGASLLRLTVATVDRNEQSSVRRERSLGASASRHLVVESGLGLALLAVQADVVLDSLHLGPVT